MKRHIIVAVLFLGSACNVRAEDERVILRTIDWKPVHKQNEQRVFNSREELEKVWKADGGEEAEMPSVDWDREMVLAVFFGKLIVPLWMPDKVRIEDRGDRIAVIYGVIHIRETLEERLRDKPERQVEFPAHLVVVKKTPKPVEFMDARFEKKKP